jgi:acetyl-CoA acyltransferase
MNEAVICGAIRTPIGRVRGGLSSVRPDDLAAHVLRSLVERTGIPPEAVESVTLGCANQAGEDNRNVARMATLLAGLPEQTAGVTVNRLCASGLEAVIQASRALKVGEEAVCLAGGVESMSRAPWSMPKPEMGHPSGNVTAYDTALGWRYPNPGLEALFPLEAMGETAENVAERWGIAREDQDAFAYESHRRAVAAWEAGRFDEEVAAVPVPQRKGAPVSFGRDEGPRADTSVEKLATLRPVFREGGSVTAGNSSTLNDGAAALLLMTPEAARHHGLKPWARILAGASVGVDPRTMGIGPVPAVTKALKIAGLGLDAIDLFEINEAFAAQALACIRELGLDPERVNPGGGAIALGHPLGCSGARILTSLLFEMRRRGAKRGVATLCVGVGQGTACVVEAVD